MVGTEAAAMTTLFSTVNQMTKGTRLCVMSPPAPMDLSSTVLTIEATAAKMESERRTARLVLMRTESWRFQTTIAGSTVSMRSTSVLHAYSDADY